MRSPKQFERVLRKYFSGDYIAIFDAEDNLYHLKKPATALDFVCHAYPKRFTKLSSIRVNGRKTEIDKPLKDGDVVTPEFGRNTTYKKDWLELSLSPVTHQKMRAIDKRVRAD